MKPEYEVIQKICEKMPAPDFPELPTLTGYGVLRLMNSLTVEFGRTVADVWLRGFLLDHATLKAVWGEKEIEFEVSCEPLDGSYQVYEPSHMPAYLYHGHNLLALPTAEDMLNYYNSYL